MLERLVWFGRLGMLVLMYTFLWRLSTVLLRSFDATNGEVKQADQPMGGVMLRVLKHSCGVWVQRDSVEIPVEAGGVVIPADHATLGRSTGNSIRLGDPFASASHARLIWKRNSLYLQDLKTTNGTRVNNESVQGLRRLKTGDIIEIGNTSFVVERQ